MSDRVREPIQTYLSRDERVALDRIAAELGVSRSEALRRGVEALGAGGAGAAPGAGRSGAGMGSGQTGSGQTGSVLTPAKSRGAGPPPSMPVARLAELLAELDEDRSDR